MQLNDLEQDVYQRTNKNTTPDAVTRTRVRLFINQRHRRLLSMIGVGGLREDVFTFASVVNQQRYALPQGIAQLHRVWETTTPTRLTKTSLTRLRDILPVQTGVPQWWVPLGYTAIAAQPSNASAIFVDSTSASDTGTVYLEGVLSTGERRAVSQVMTGTSGLQIGTLSTWAVLERVYLSVAAVGTVTITEDAENGTELARITIGQTAPRYYSILLDPTPTSAITYSCDASYQIGDMSVLTDVPLLPDDFHYLIACGARIDEYEKLDDKPRRDMAVAEWTKGITDLKWWLANTQSDDTPLTLPRRSNLGAQFPAGRW